MSKLYAELTSDKGGRVASKGGDGYILLHVTHKNIALWDITIGASGALHITCKGKSYTLNALNFPELTKTPIEQCGLIGKFDIQ